ncbi:hypothetical protein FKW77_007334 [Venturia effusa]|uniref:Uncharacterized protein n=1 Tax=Venturia effusa TaxID=50376 RepID=A0A517L5R5_9PEZI|nr:hypothetical protein FKW77_007334 [Venturia effusa]
MDALLRDFEKQREQTDREQQQRERDRHNGPNKDHLAQYTGLVKDATTFQAASLKRRAGSQDHPALKLFPTREEIRAEKRRKLTDPSASPQKSSPTSMLVPQDSQDASEDPKIAGPISKGQSNSPISRPMPQQPLGVESPQQSEVKPITKDKNKTVFLPTSQARLDDLRDIVDDMLTTTRPTVWTKLCHAPEIRTELGDATYQEYLQGVLSKSSSAVRVSMLCFKSNEWVYDNGGRKYKLDVPWKDIKPYVKSLKVLVDQGDDTFTNKKVKQWLKDHVKNAPKLSRVELSIRYREGFIDTMKVDKFGADMDWQYGKKDKTMRFAQDLWSFTALKRVSFTVQKTFARENMYNWCSTERDQDKKIWKDWTSGRWTW